MKSSENSRTVKVWGAVVVLCLVPHVGIAATLSHSHTQEMSVAQIRRKVQRENTRNVGKTLPSGINVLNHTGNKVDLQQVLHGRVLLVKVAMDCPPCLEMMGWIRKNGLKYENKQHARLAILLVRSATPLKRTFPPGVMLLHTTSSLFRGFLGGTATPAEFFFDDRQKLVARRTGYDPDDVMKNLRFPRAALPATH